MKKNEIDMWIVACREYNEDPIFCSLVPAMVRNASKLTILIFALESEGSISRYCIGAPYPPFTPLYSPIIKNGSESEWACVHRLMEEKQPLKIGLNMSQNIPLADGLSKVLYDNLEKELGAWRNRWVSSENLCINWIETRTEFELQKYGEIYQIALDIIADMFSKENIRVGETMTTDLEWFMMERIHDLSLEAWFTPTVDLQRQGYESKRIHDQIIQYGDILHCDIGISYLGLCTDTQRIAYVLKPDENNVPQGLVCALSECNQFQDIVASKFQEGKTGNEIFIESIDEAGKKGIKAMLYNHPIGPFGHGLGPYMGLYGRQEPLPGIGEYILNLNTCYALELNTSSTLKEWNNQEIVIYLEESVSFTEKGLSYLKDRQSEWITI